MLKAELHAHTSDDPVDFIPYDAVTLVDRAADLGYKVLAITLHDKQFDVRQVSSYARERGVVLIPGVERTLCGKHVLLLNFPQAAEQVRSFDDVKRLKARWNGVVIAPHPFYPAPSCLRRCLDRAPELFDVVELNAFYTASLDFNRRARAWARVHSKPLVGNGDIHRLRQLGTTFSLLDAEPDRDAVCQAIRAGQVEIRTRPLSLFRAASHFTELLAGDLAKRLCSRAEDNATAVVADV